MKLATKLSAAASALVVGSSLHAAPFLAIGDNAELFVTAGTGVRYEDNVFFAPSGFKEDTFAFTFTPGIEILFGKNSLFKGSFVLQEQFTEYTENAVRDTNLTVASFRGSYDGSRWTSSVSAGFRELNQNTRGLLGLIRRDVYDFSLRGEYALTEKSKLASGVTYSRTQYKGPGFNDQTTFGIPLNYYYAVLPKVDLSAGFSFRHTDVSGGANRDDYFFNVGARGEFTPKLTGSFKVGYTVRDRQGANSTGILGLDAGLAYLYSPKTRFTLDLANEFDTSALGQNQEVFSVTVGASTQINPALNLGTSLRYQAINYPGPRSDDYVAASLFANYVYNQFLTLGAFYTYTENSSGGFADFAANVISVSANFRY